MTTRDREDRGPAPTRRAFLSRSGLAAVAAGSVITGSPASADPVQAEPIEPFFGPHQGGILTLPQAHTYFASFDLTAGRRDGVVTLLRRWTEAAALLAEGQQITASTEAADEVAEESSALDLSPARLTLTFGFGAGLFVKGGRDRYGLAVHRPEAFVDLPSFPGDQLVPARTGGDLSVQACADNPQVAFHAVRALANLASGLADLRWVQAGYLPTPPGGKTPRNLMGFKDGSGNLNTASSDEMHGFVWAGRDAPPWINGGSYLVVRRARMALEHWDRTKVAFQEQTFGRRKASGAPLGANDEFDPVDLAALDPNGDPVIPENSHVRIAHQASLDGARILRRSYSYNDGANVVAERWPPWRQGMEFDAGLLFVCYQRDPRQGFIKIFDRMSRLDMMNQFVTNIGGGLFACPGGIARGEYVGQRLFEARA